MPYMKGKNRRELPWWWWKPLTKTACLDTNRGGTCLSRGFPKGTRESAQKGAVPFLNEQSAYKVAGPSRRKCGFAERRSINKPEQLTLEPSTRPHLRPCEA